MNTQTNNPNRRERRDVRNSTGLGQLIWTRRILANFSTREDFADAIGVTWKTVERWELGDSRPRFENLYAISDATGTPFEDFKKAWFADKKKAILASDEPIDLNEWKQGFRSALK